VAVGATILLTSYGIFQKEFWQFLMKEKATSVSGVPYTYEMLKRIGFLDMDLPHLTTMTQAGGRLSPKLQEEYGEFALKNNKKFVVMYGQTEATARMSYLPPKDVVRKSGSIGIAIPGGGFFLVDENENVITEPNVTGELIYKGPNVTMGYAQCMADLQKEDEWEGILHTGDMAKRDEDGYYYITGRKKRFVKLYGNRVSLDETEKILREYFDEEFACCGQDDHMKIFSTLDRGEEVVTYLAEQLRQSDKAFEYKKIDKIPKNEAGKTLYTELELL
jgi:acyl-coenzyme A synthetase/AMP-(fatty) acid ligase